MNLDTISLFPEINERANTLYGVISAVTAVILFAGLLVAAFRGAIGNVSELLRTVVTVVIQVLLISQFPGFAKLIQQTADAVVTQLDASPAEVHLRFARLLGGSSIGDEKAPQDLIDVLLADEGGFGAALIYATTFLVGKIAWLLMWLFYVIQGFIAIYGVALAPLFIGMLILNATRGISVRYFMSLLGVAVWPVGWALASLMTDALLEMAVNGKAVDLNGNQFVFAAQTLFIVVLVSIWVLVSTIATPKLIAEMIQHGSQIGAAVLGSMSAGLSRGAGYAVSSGTTASVAGASPLGVGTAAAIGAGGGLLSGAVGSSGTFGSAAIGAMAINALGKESMEEEARKTAQKQRENA